MSLGHNVKMRAEKRWETRKTTVVTWPRRTSEISPPKARWMHHPFLGDGFLQPWYDIDRRLSSKHVAALVPWVKQLLTQKHSWRYCDDVLSRGFSISTNRRNRKYAFVISHLAYFQRASCKLCWKYFNCFHKKKLTSNYCNYILEIYSAFHNLVHLYCWILTHSSVIDCYIRWQYTPIFKQIRQVPTVFAGI